MKPHHLKIIASTGYAFFLTLAGMFTMNSFYNLNVPFEFYVGTSLLVAFVNAGLTFFRELLREAEEGEGNNGNAVKTENVNRPHGSKEHKKKLCKSLDMILAI